MDTYPTLEPTTAEPIPARVGRGEPSRLRVLATSAAVAGLTATGGGSGPGHASTGGS